MKNKIKLINNFLFTLLSISIPYVSIITLIVASRWYRVDEILGFSMGYSIQFWVLIGTFSSILNLYEYFTDNKILMDKKYNIMIGIYNISIITSIIYNLLLSKASIISLVGISTDIMLSVLILVYNLLAKEYPKEKFKIKVGRLLKIFNNIIYAFVICLALSGLYAMLENINFDNRIIGVVIAVIASLVISCILTIKDITLNKGHNKKVVLITILSIISVVLYGILDQMEKIPKVLIIVLLILIVISVITALITFIFDAKNYIKSFNNDKVKILVILMILVFLIFVFTSSLNWYLGMYSVV